ncbi:phosphoribosylanthranilate isomerase [Peribacillus sp. NPDC101481]|jgi:phosphoribosylanthranilate isomerase|uniref:phosphoribosylanthranilate isomerase n=1 Tax=Bacillaceae TaxID=186817 RepID=UPI001924F3F8|nr:MULTISPECIES: phosphoribosylanthranilate isomerase [Bacillaceae]CAH0262566.1 N-(5'-phosphoribosyl)anthranilate isomerase [Peribacillus sp. Bi134]
MLVKICGIKTLAAAQTAVESGADFIGFIFAESSRKVEPEIVGEFGAKLAGHVKKVGVFANQTEQEVIKNAEIAGLDYIQLHGNESASFARRMPLPVIKAFAVNSEKDLENLHEYPADYLLVDLPKSSSGKGLTLDWEMIRKAELPLGKVILAGGLTPENVGKAIDAVSPFAVDVASGVETNGLKDAAKIKAFINEAKYTAGKEE